MPIHEMGGFRWQVPPSESARWTNINIVDGVLSGTYGTEFPGIVVDIGSNIGSFTVLASKTADKIIAYEPSTTNYEYILKNIKLNKIPEDKVKVWNLGLADKKGDRLLYINPVNCGAFSMVNHGEDGATNTTTIKVVTLEDVFKDNDLTYIDWLKVDAESAEWEFMLNNPLLSKVKNIRMELHKHLPEHDTTEFQNYLKNLGFKILKFERAHTPTAYNLWASK